MEDNARKFIVNKIDQDFLKEQNALGFLLIVDWMITEENSEKKVVYKKFDTGDIQFIFVEKVTENGSRTTNKKKLTEREYETLLLSSTAHLKKKRFEFDFIQGEITFSMKYDEFENEGLCMIEVDASSESQRNYFSPTNFPWKLKEVTGEIEYYGYRIANRKI